MFVNSLKNPTYPGLYRDYYTGHLKKTHDPIPLDDDAQFLQKVEQSIREARKIAVSECSCRKEAILLGEGCDEQRSCHAIEAVRFDYSVYQEKREALRQYLKNFVYCFFRIALFHNKPV